MALIKDYLIELRKLEKKNEAVTRKSVPNQNPSFSYLE
jgi:hypothetical protein